MLNALKLPRMETVQPVIRDGPFSDKDWTFELKYDGFRGRLYIERGRRPRVISRDQKVLHQFESLGERILDALDVEDAVIDGEVIAYDRERRPKFMDLVRYRLAPTLIAFDLLWWNGEDLRGKSLLERRKLLHRHVPHVEHLVERPIHEDWRGELFFEKLCLLDLEGMVAKRLSDPYHHRLTKWYKILNPEYSQKEEEERKRAEKVFQRNKRKK